LDSGTASHAAIRALLRLSLGGWLRAVAAFASAALILAVPAGATDLRPRLVLAGPPAMVSYPLIHVVESGALGDLAQSVEFVPWRDPDHLRALALEGKADFSAMPTNVAANLFNRGVKLQLLNVSTWGILYLVSREANLKTLADFKGKEILIPFRGDMPDIVFQLLARAAGLDHRRDFRRRYVASPFEAAQLLIARHADHAVLHEPAVSLVLRQGPELHRSVDLQREWGRLLNRRPRIPQAGIAAMGRALGDATLIARFQQAYAASLQWCRDEPEACGAVVAKRLPMLSAPAVADSLRVGQLAFVPAHEAKPELEFFFGKLRAWLPALVGGGLPAEGFYYRP
jgi:NitT/TauT family transport system substrate-binding protein